MNGWVLLMFAGGAAGGWGGSVWERGESVGVWVGMGVVAAKATVDVSGVVMVCALWWRGS